MIGVALDSQRLRKLAGRTMRIKQYLMSGILTLPGGDEYLIHGQDGLSIIHEITTTIVL